MALELPLASRTLNSTTVHKKNLMVACTVQHALRIIDSQCQHSHPCHVPRKKHFGYQTARVRLLRPLAISYASLISRINPHLSGVAHPLIPSHSGVDK